MKLLKLITVFTIFLSAACGSTNGTQEKTDSTQSTNDSSSADHTSTSISKDTTNMVKEDLNKDDGEFAMNAANGGMAEVAMGKIAETNAASQRVKDFGAMMVKDHSEGDDKLKQIASQKKIVLPESLSSNEQKHLDELSKKTGTDFDNDYMRMMIEDHKDDIKEFQKAAIKCKDADIKNFAITTLPVLQKHLDSAVAIYNKH